VRFRRHKQASGIRRKRPRSERLIIAMTLVVGAVWFASFFRSASIGYHSQPPVVLWNGVFVEGGYVAWIDLGPPPTYESGFGVSSRVRWPRGLGTLKHQFIPLVYWDWGYKIVIVPLGSLLAVFPAVIFLPSALRTSHRRRRNRCVACGYAQDDALERCPECGRLASEPSIGFWLSAWRAYRWPLVCIAINVGVTLVAIAVLN